MMRVRNHPLVLTKSLHEQIGYDDAEDMIRGQARRGDPVAARAVQEIEAADARLRAEMVALNKDMTARLGMSAEEVNALVATLESDPDLERWLIRRVNLTRALGRALTAEEHHENSND